MPIYMDRHIVPGIEAKHAAQAHREDLKIQDEFNCRCMTYWVDVERESAFCLIDAPNIEAVKQMHDRAHGLLPHEIIKVNSNVVEAFLGRVSDPKGYLDTNDPELKIFNDPAFRIILVANIDNPILLENKLGKEKSKKLLAIYNEIIGHQIIEHEGREVEAKGESFIASFISVTQAVKCAIAIIKGLHFAGELLDLRLGINAGMPVDKSKELFGDTVKMANYLCQLADNNQVMIASIIREIYKDDRSSIINEHFRWIDPREENFIQLLFNTIAQNFQNPTFGIEDFCNVLGMSKSNLYRYSTSLTGSSVNSILRDYRLLKSLTFLKSGRNISQTAFDCGFSSPSYFTKCFQKKFILKPKYFLKYSS